MIENFAGDGNQNEIVAAVALPVGNPRRPVEPVEFEAVEFLSVNTRAKNNKFACGANQNEIGATPAFVELPSTDAFMFSLLDERAWKRSANILAGRNVNHFAFPETSKLENATHPSLFFITCEKPVADQGRCHIFRIIHIVHFLLE